MFRPRFELRFACFAAVALLIAQLGAIAHAYAHLTVARAELQQPLPSQHEACGECLNFAPLLAAAAAPTVLPLLLAPPRADAVVAPRATRSAGDLALAFRSRAPPDRR
jgi:hypothetical protein